MKRRRPPSPVRPRRHERASLWKLFPMMAEVLPEGSSGNVEIRHFTLTAEEARERSAERVEVWTAGTYAELAIGGLGWMYDILQERLWNRRVVEEARGDVLVAGLGLGMILHPILAKPEVRSVRVLEVNPHVTRLVSPSLARVEGASKLTIEEADAETWRGEPGAYDTVWLDVVPFYSWSSVYLRICEEWIERFRPYVREGGWIGHWAYLEVLQEILDDGPGTKREVSGNYKLTVEDARHLAMGLGAVSAGRSRG